MGSNPITRSSEENRGSLKGGPLIFHQGMVVGMGEGVGVGVGSSSDSWRANADTSNILKSNTIAILEIFTVYLQLIREINSRMLCGKRVLYVCLFVNPGCMLRPGQVGKP